MSFEHGSRASPRVPEAMRSIVFALLSNPMQMLRHS